MSVQESTGFLPWSAERLRLLMQYWEFGWSAARIARELGNTTRNAVLGKVNRMNLPPRAMAWTTPEEKKLKRDEYRARTRDHINAKAREQHARRRGRFALVMEKERRPPKLSQKLAGAIEPAPASCCGFAEITRQRCRWVVGEPNGWETIFCGAVVVEEQSYCAHHYVRTRTGPPKYTGKRTFTKRKSWPMRGLNGRYI
jgi:GcrA cell cycle regulator